MNFCAVDSENNLLPYFVFPIDNITLKTLIEGDYLVMGSCMYTDLARTHKVSIIPRLSFPVILFLSFTFEDCI